jgi:hypothetical protein
MRKRLIAAATANLINERTEPRSARITNGGLPS